MRFKAKFLILFTTLLVVFGVTAGVSYFYFGDEVNTNQDIENSESVEGQKDEVFSDNILENYEFGNKKNLNETYTYYFFPSTLYEEIAVTDEQDPETAFGYNEVVLNDMGLPIINSNGEVEYNVVNYGDDESIIGLEKDGVTYASYYDYLTQKLNSNEEYYFNSAYNKSAITPSYSISSYNITYNTKSEGKQPCLTDVKHDSNHSDDYYYKFSYPDFGKLISNDPYIINNPDLIKSHKSENLIDVLNGLEEEYNRIINKCKNVFGDSVLSLNRFSVDGVWIDYNGIDESEDGSDGVLFGWGRRDGYLYYTYSIDTNSLKEQLDNYLEEVYKNEVYSPRVNNSDYGLDLDYNSNAIASNGQPSPYGEMSDDLREEIKYFIDNVQSGGKINDNECSNFGYYYNYEEQFQNRRQYRNDRFGFWTDFYDLSDPSNIDYDITSNSGSRYLPIKITVNGNLSPDVFAEILPNVLNSTYDRDGYFDSTSNSWVYNTYDDNNKIDISPYSKATDGFTPKDISNLFDIMQNPEKFADSDNVIRLYPIFSNGKNYTDDRANTSASEGGKDPVKAEFYYNSSVSNNDLDTLISHKKLTYSSEIWTSYSNLNSGNSYNLNYLVLKNIYLEKGLYNKIVFRTCYTYWKFEYSGTWEESFTLDSSYLNSFIDKYGEGLYTFYFIVGNAYNNADSKPNPIKNDFPLEITPTEQNKDPVDFADVSNKITSKGTSFNSLYGKNLIECPTNTTNVGKYYGYMINTNDGGRYSDNYTGTKGVALLVEKVTNLRLVSDLPIQEGGNNDWSEIDSDVKNGLTTAKNFVIIGNDNVKTYNYNSDGTMGTENVPDSPYIYLLQNADFRYVNNLYFQIRFSNTYISNAMKIVTDFNEYGSNQLLNGKTRPDSYANVDIGGQDIEFTSQRELIGENENVFIQNVSATGTDGKIRNGFKLRDYLSKGVYDILLVSYGNVIMNEGQDDEYTIQLFNMYVNRHKNSFIKVFDGYPGSFTIKGGDSTFISHKQEGDGLIANLEPSKEEVEGKEEIDAYANTHLIWKGQAYLGDLFSTNTPNDEGISFINSLKTYFATKTDGEYELIDAVTGKAMAYLRKNGTDIEFFNSNGSTNDNTVEILQVLKNYVLYFQQVPQSSTGS